MVNAVWGAPNAAQIYGVVEIRARSCLTQSGPRIAGRISCRKLQTPTEDRHLLTTPQLESRLAVFMGGYAAEHLVFGHISTGAENDLKEATRLATKMVAHYGMSAALGPAYYDHDVEHPFLGRRIATDGGSSDATTHAIELEARRVLALALDRASTLLAAHRCHLDRLVQGLLDKETLETNELRALLGSSVKPTSAPIPAAVSYEPAA